MTLPGTETIILSFQLLLFPLLGSSKAEITDIHMLLWMLKYGAKIAGKSVKVNFFTASWLQKKKSGSSNKHHVTPRKLLPIFGNISNSYKSETCTLTWTRKIPIKLKCTKQIRWSINRQYCSGSVMYFSDQRPNLICR